MNNVTPMLTMYNQAALIAAVRLRSIIFKGAIDCNVIIKKMVVSLDANYFEHQSN